MALLSRIQHLSGLNIDNEPTCMRKTSIICTIGPKTNSIESMVALRKAGMNIVRLNFSHGTHEYHASVVQNVRDSFKFLDGRPTAIALDTKGPEIRSGMIERSDGVEIEQGHTFLLTSDEAYKEKGNADIVYIDYPNMAHVLQPGSLVYIDDGILSLTVKEVDEANKRVRVCANNSHCLLSRKGVNLPNARVDLPALSAKDVEDLGFAVKHDLDMIFASFIRKAEDVIHIRNVLGEAGKDIKIISKIENHEGVRNFDEILAVSDGIMVARGDLGIEIPAEKVFVAQKMMIAKCNTVGKSVICATQMLESMTTNPRPTRAEVSDVANAVLDGSDCVMLSAETARGHYPIEAVKIMGKICVEAENTIAYSDLFEELRNLTLMDECDVSETLASSAVNASLEGYVSAIVVLTISGNSARQVARYRPKVPIITVTRHPRVARQCHLYRGCYPLVYEAESFLHPGETWQENVDARINWALEQAKNMNLIKSGNVVVAIQGWKGGIGNTNTMRMIKVA